MTDTKNFCAAASWRNVNPYETIAVKNIRKTEYDKFVMMTILVVVVMISYMSVVDLIKFLINVTHQPSPVTISEMLSFTTPTVAIGLIIIAIAILAKNFYINIASYESYEICKATVSDIQSKNITVSVLDGRKLCSIRIAIPGYIAENLKIYDDIEILKKQRKILSDRYYVLNV